MVWLADGMIAVVASGVTTREQLRVTAGRLQRMNSPAQQIVRAEENVARSEAKEPVRAAASRWPLRTGNWRSGVAELADEDDPSALEESAGASPSRLSSLRNGLFSMRLGELRQPRSVAREEDEPSSSWEPISFAEESVPSPAVRMPARATDTALTHSPETGSEEMKRRSAIDGLDRLPPLPMEILLRDSWEDVRTLPARRGQYRWRS